jgi:hypothetical protein
VEGICQVAYESTETGNGVATDASADVLGGGYARIDLNSCWTNYAEVMCNVSTEDAPAPNGLPFASYSW